MEEGGIKKLGRSQWILIVLLATSFFTNAYSWNYRYEKGLELGYSDGSEDGFKTGYVQGNETGYGIGEEYGFREGYDEGEIYGFNVGNVTGYKAGSSDGHEEGFNLGKNIGYNDGYSEGYSTGETYGFNDGYSLGETQGYADGLEIGYSDGMSDGYDSGYNYGNETGWELGYSKGLDDGADSGWVIRNPSYYEMKSFLIRDRTDTLEATDEFTCYSFSATLKKNSFDEGYFCFFVYVRFPEDAHAIVAFNTTDRGLKYVEPQTDEIMNVEIGKCYWPRSDYLPPSFDDKVIAIDLVP